MPENSHRSRIFKGDGGGGRYFPKDGVPIYFLVENFLRNCRKMKEIGFRRGAHLWVPPPLIRQCKIKVRYEFNVSGPSYFPQYTWKCHTLGGYFLSGSKHLLSWFINIHCSFNPIERIPSLTWQNVPNKIDSAERRFWHSKIISWLFPRICYGFSVWLTIVFTLLCVGLTSFLLNCESPYSAANKDRAKKSITDNLWHIYALFMEQGMVLSKIYMRTCELIFVRYQVVTHSYLD